MEMMIVLLIVAVVAAASAPMVSKKMVRDTINDSPWTWANSTNYDIVYNSGNKDQRVSIGGKANIVEDTRLYVAGGKKSVFVNANDSEQGIYAKGGSKAQITLADTASTPNVMNLISKNGSIAIWNREASSVQTTGAVAIGKDSQISSYDDIAIGNGALCKPGSAYSIAIGSDAHTSKGCAVAIGNDSVANGASSVAIGDDAGASGDYSIALGYDASASNKNSTAIGYNAVTDADNQIMLGNSDGSTTVVVPGTLKVLGNLDLSALSGTITLGNDSAVVKIPGDLVVGHVAAALELFSADALTVWGKNRHYLRDNSGDKFCGIDIKDDKGNAIEKVLKWYPAELWNKYNPENQVTSDRRLKNVGKASVDGLEKIKKLEVFNYTFKKDPNKTPRVGVIAQDLEKVFPNAVFKGDDGFLRIRMEDMFYAMVNASKELDAKIENIANKIQEFVELKTDIAKIKEENVELKKEIKDLKKQFSELEKRLDRLEK